MKRVAFIGLGNMGLPMASNLTKNNYDVVGLDLSEEAMKSAEEKGIKCKKDINEVIKDIDCLISMLPAGEHVENLYIEQGILNKIDSSILMIDCSTIDPLTSQKVASKASELGLNMLDAPVSGGVVGAESASLTFIVGGSSDNLSKAKPILESMGKNIFHAGGSGLGQVAKVCNNMLLAIHMCGTAETIAMGVNNGLDPEILSEIMKNSSGGNWSLEKYNPYPGVMKEVPASNHYSGGFLNSLMLKDLNLAKELAVQSKSETPMGTVAKQLYEELNKQGFGNLDFSSVQKNYSLIKKD
jgi:3-hydroxyisobutyrate dehydrogenase